MFKELSNKLLSSLLILVYWHICIDTIWLQTEECYGNWIIVRINISVASIGIGFQINSLMAKFEKQVYNKIHHLENIVAPIVLVLQFGLFIFGKQMVFSWMVLNTSNWNQTIHTWWKPDICRNHVTLQDFLTTDHFLSTSIWFTWSMHKTPISGKLNKCAKALFSNHQNWDNRILTKDVNGTLATFAQEFLNIPRKILHGKISRENYIKIN